MTTIDTRPEHGALSLTDSTTGEGALTGVVRWVTTTDHKRIGRLFIGSGLVLLAATLVVGGLLGLERVQPDSTFLQANSINQMFSLYRIGFSFLVVTPLVLGLAIAVVPLQLGARAIALGRVAALGFWSWLFGSGTVIAAFIGNGGPGGGKRKMVDLFLAGMALTILGLIAAAVAVVVSVLTTRAPGMTLRRAPGFAWASLVGGTALVLTLPVLLGDIVLLAVDHHYVRTAGFGSNLDLLTWMGWALTQPATYVLVIPVLGIVADIVVTASHRKLALRTPLLLGVGLLGTGALGAVTQKQHLLNWPSPFGSHFGDKLNDLLPFAIFNLLPILGPLLVLGVCGQALAAGRLKLPSPAAFLFAFTGSGLLLLGVAAHALTNIVQLQLVGTTYEEGVFVLVAGGAVLVTLGGIVHWGPKLWGRTLPSGAVVPITGLGALGVLLAGVPLLIAGFQGQPAMTASGYDYKLSPQGLNSIAAVGQALLLLTVIAFVLLALKGFSGGDLAGDDPWNGQTLEWATSSPPPDDNFAEVHRVSSAQPLLDLKPSGSDA